MSINNIHIMNPVTPLQQNDSIQQSTQDEKGKVSFSNVLKNALEKVNEAVHESDVKTEALAEGKVDNLHDVMLSAQKANIMVETAVQFQQKAIDTYNEVMRMQI